MSEHSIDTAPRSMVPTRRRSWQGYAIWLAAAVLIAVAPLVFDSGHSVSMMTHMGVAIVFALSYNMLLGQGGMLSFGHAVYSGLGGFIAMHALNAMQGGALGLPLELLPLIGGLGGLLFAVPFGWISTKRSGVTFAMISLGLAELVAASALMFTGFFGGESGVAGNRVIDNYLLGFLDVTYGPSLEVYYLVGIWTLIAAFVMFVLTKTPLGRMANAVRDNPERAEFVGYDTHMVRFVQFSLSGFFAGIAGGLAAIMFEIVTADAVSAVASGTVLLMTFIGGVGYFFGPVLGAMLVTYLQTELSTFSEAWMLYFGLIFVGMVMFAPAGLAGIIMAHAPTWRAGLMGTLLRAYAVAAVPVLIFLVGVIAMIEMAYHLSTAYMPERPMDLFYMEVVATSVMSWGVAILATAVGAVLSALALRYVRKAWDDVDNALGRGE